MARKNDDMALQTRALVKDLNGERMAFVQHDSGLFALPGDYHDRIKEIGGKNHRVFNARFTTLAKIKEWAKANDMSVTVNSHYPIFYQSHKDAE